MIGDWTGDGFITLHKEKPITDITDINYSSPIGIGAEGVIYAGSYKGRPVAVKVDCLD